MYETGVAHPGQFQGCSADEVAALEARYGIVLPVTYRRFLEVMGHCPGQLFAHDHVKVNYPQILQMTEDERRWHRDEPEEQPLNLPDDALIVLGRFDQQFQFIHCQGTPDAAIYYYEVGEPAARYWSSSIANWLNAWCDEAACAVARRTDKGDI